MTIIIFFEKVASTSAALKFKNKILVKLLEVNDTWATEHFVFQVKGKIEKMSFEQSYILWYQFLYI